MPATTPPSLHMTLWVFPEQSVITMKNNVPATDSCIICPQLSVTSWPGRCSPERGPPSCLGRCQTLPSFSGDAQQELLPPNLSFSLWNLGYWSQLL